MIRLKHWLPAIAAVAVLALGQGVRAETGRVPTRNVPAAELDPASLAAKIDHFVEARWAQKNIKPAPLASDAEFMRRIYLDLTGRIPRVSEVRDFLDDKSPDKRARLIESLLENPRHVMHLSNTWRSIMLPASNDQQQFFSQSFKTWVDKQVQSNAPYDQMVRELLVAAANFNVPNRGGIQAMNLPNNVSPIAFYQANEFKAENLAAATSRVFLGVRLECAQCHDHPFAKWSKNQFWEYAAFFSGVQQVNRQPKLKVKQPQPAVKQPNGREITIPGTDKVVEAKFLDGKAPAWKDDVDSRDILADWFVSAENPYFAQTGANRVWAHFFGLGIIDPVDDEPTDENPSSHPELLAELTQQFVAHKFDVKYLMRAIALSKTYQRTSVASHPSQNEPRLFARMAVKGMSPEQLFDSLALATGFQENVGNPNIRAIGQPGNARFEFLQRFATQDKKTETQTSILQALAMMNGTFIANATSLDKSNTLAAVLDSPFMDDAQRIETLYLATVSRLPRQDEAERMLKYVSSGGPRNDARAAMTDVFWVLLNSSEFMLNH
jgi:hypothetical protein